MPLLLLVAFVAVPVVEFIIAVQIAHVISVPLTLLILVAASIAGGWLVRREGARAWRALRAALASGRLPAREGLDGALVLVGGALLITPGFLTDAVGLLMVLPGSRRVFRSALLALIARRTRRLAARLSGGYVAAAPAGSRRGRRSGYGRYGSRTGDRGSAAPRGPVGPADDAGPPPARPGAGQIIDGAVGERDSPRG